VRQAEIATRLALLTPREHEVMEMVADGRSNKEIANALGVSAKTVEAHRARVMEKMEARSLAELVRMVLTANLGERS
jgi:FixJ family two-component response regulator